MNPVLSYIQKMCETALMEEVSTTPKPGLVDRNDNGSHTDMSYDTFVASTSAIVPYLTQMAQTGYEWLDAQGTGLFAAIRPIGIRAEQAMFLSTDGVNTHKGMIFSMGTVAAAAGLFFATHKTFCSEKILLLAGTMCKELLEQDFASINKNQPNTHGEKLYVHYGIKGIRGEAQEGFPSIRHTSLPAIRQYAHSSSNKNEQYLNTLLTLMAEMEDTNVLIRTSPQQLVYEQDTARYLLSLGGPSTPEGMTALIQANEDFIQRNISPGGCADMLAVTIFLWHLEQYQKEDSYETI